MNNIFAAIIMNQMHMEEMDNEDLQLAEAIEGDKIEPVDLEKSKEEEQKQIEGDQLKEGDISEIKEKKLVHGKRLIVD